MSNHQTMARGLIGGDMTTPSDEEEKVEEGTVDSKRPMSPSSFRSNTNSKNKGSLKAEAVDPLALDDGPVQAVLIDNDATSGNDEENSPVSPPNSTNQNEAGSNANHGNDETVPPLDVNLTSLLNSNNNEQDSGEHHDLVTSPDIVKPTGRTRLMCYWIIYTIGIMRIFFGGAFIGGATSFYKVVSSSPITRMIVSSSSTFSLLARGLGTSNGEGDLNRELQYSWGNPTFSPTRGDSDSSSGGSGSGDSGFDGSCSFIEMTNKTYSPEALAEYNNLFATLSGKDVVDWNDLPLFVVEFNRHCKDSGGAPLKFTFLVDKDCNWDTDNSFPRPIDEPFCFETDCTIDEAKYVTQTQYFVDLDPRCVDNIKFRNCTSLDLSSFVESSAASTEYNNAMTEAASSGDDFFDWEKLTLGMKEVEEYCMNELGGNLFKVTYGDSAVCPWPVSVDENGNKILRPVNLPTCFSKSCSLDEVFESFTANYDKQECRDNLKVVPGAGNSLGGGGGGGGNGSNNKLPTSFFGVASGFLLIAEMLEFVLGFVDKNVPRGKGRNVHNIMIFVFNCLGSILLTTGGVLTGLISLANNKYSGILWTVGGILLTIGNSYDIVLNFCVRVNYKMYVLVAVSKIISTIANLVIAAGGISSISAVTGASSSPQIFYLLLVVGGVFYIIHGILFLIGFAVPGASCLCQCN